MSTALTLHQVDAPAVTTDQMELIRKTIAKDATADELRLFLYDCQRQGVHPLDKLVHFTKRGGKYTPVTSIDFMRSRAADSMEYAGNDDPRFEMGEDPKHPVAATVTVYRLVQGQKCSFTATARWTEYLPEQAFMWKKMPFTMLGKCAEALALRKAFPRQLAGLYSSEEMDQARKAKDAEQGDNQWTEDESKQYVERKIKELKHDEPATEADEIERWKSVISCCVKAEDFNGMIPMVKDKPNVVKMALMTEALNKGFKFDKASWEFCKQNARPETPLEREMDAVNPIPASRPTTTRGATSPMTADAPPGAVAATVSDDGLVRIVCHVSDAEKRKKKAGGDYWLLQCDVEGAEEPLAVQVWDAKLFERASALMGKDATLGCRRKETGDKVYYSLEAIY